MEFDFEGAIYDGRFNVKLSAIDEENEHDTTHC
jgi:hypothetical protein